MSVASASFQIITPDGSYNFDISSCNPRQPVSFALGDQPYDPNRRQVSGALGVMGRPQRVTIVTFPQVAVPTTWNQNPIKLTVTTANGEGSYSGRTNVFYGYYLGANGNGLGFYLNVEQSNDLNDSGQAGFPCKIDNEKRIITLA